jgi:hypothetical protein
MVAHVGREGKLVADNGMGPRRDGCHGSGYTLVQSSPGQWGLEGIGASWAL